MSDLITESSVPIAPDVSRRIEKIIDDNSRQIRNTIKWQLGFTERKQGGYWPKERKAELLDGLFRSKISEALGVNIPIKMCETVYPPHPDNTATKITTFQRLFGQQSKHGILARVIEKSLDELDKKALKRIKRWAPDMVRFRKDMELGYSHKIDTSWKGNPEGIFYGDSVNPDGVLLNDKGEIVGLLEVKAYLPDEMEALIDYLEKNKYETWGKITMEKNGKERELKLGADVDGEVEFIDHVRGAGFGLDKLGGQTEMLFRFPKDIPPEPLIKYGQRLRKLGYAKVMIQKLPLSSDELRERGKKFIKDNLANIKEQRGANAFSNKEIQILEEYIE